MVSVRGAPPAISRRAGKVVGYPPLSEMNELQRRDFHEALLDADTFEESAWEVAAYGHCPPQLPLQLAQPGAL
jgi:hypothetical protein